MLRRYAYASTASHDVNVCPQIITDDYVLRMGGHTLQGRDGAYIVASQRQFRQFPTLGFTVHDLVLGEDRAALSFTEHGYSVRYGVGSAWNGVSLYRWDGRRLTECRVEQDITRVARSNGRASRPRCYHPVLTHGLFHHSLPTSPPQKSAGPGSITLALQTHRPARSTTSAAPQYSA
ncbi:nuclear transport factor 2 family protein [Mycobacterium marseillense]|uniref:nuclear transport factor 2 family protein n=1 Tax=Mycobacterium avium complex (MAC) TaxID=120793 RepID=UPI000C2BF0A5|nr:MULTISPECIES: nuclear transport factor 2 family protein [Mycobacterium avium complex (MAC)]MDM3973533.1 nuclear transport factor 2 family protein [Mycobacterium marseillense]